MSVTAFFRKDGTEDEQTEQTEQPAGAMRRLSSESGLPRKALFVGAGMVALAYFATRRAGSGAPVPSTDEVRETVDDVREDPGSVISIEGSEAEDEGETDGEEMEVETEVEVEAGEGVEVEVEAETELEREGENELEVESEVEVKAKRTDDEEADDDEGEVAEQADEDAEAESPEPGEMNVDEEAAEGVADDRSDENEEDEE